jgi:hypothetical protein
MSDDPAAFDDFEKVDMLLKKAFGVPATKDNTYWFNESLGKSLTIFEKDSINVYSVPDEPYWDDTSMSDASLAQYDIQMTNSGNFGSENFSEINEIYYDGNVKKYRDNGSKSPGAYLDSTKTVVLFVGLKLDIMVTPTTGTADEAIAFIKYGSDSSLNSILSNSFQFNYNKLSGNILNSDGSSSGLSAFQPYYYTLQYSKSNPSTYGFSKGNWFFDFKSGIITFADDPGDTFSSSDDQSLYFTFVKYVGPRGLDKLIDVSDNFDSTATSGFYENQIVVDSSNSEIYLMKNGSWNSIGGGGSGDLTVGGDLSVGGGIITNDIKIDGSGVIVTCDTSEYGGKNYFGGILGFGNHDDAYPGLHNYIVSYQNTDVWNMDFYVRETKMMGFVNSKGQSLQIDICYNTIISSDLTVGGAANISKTSDYSTTNDWALDVLGTARIKGGVTIGDDGVVNIINYQATGVTDNGKIENCAIQTNIDERGMHEINGLDYSTYGNLVNSRKILTLQPYFGHVGIGLTDPDTSYLLDVSGDTNISSNLTVGGAIIVGEQDGYVPNLNGSYNSTASFVANDSDLHTYWSTGSGGEQQDIYLHFDTPYSGTSNNKGCILFEGQSYSRQKIHFCLNNSTGNGGANYADINDAILSIIPDGYVGIGATSPSYPLQISSTVTNSSLPMYMIGNRIDTENYWQAGVGNDYSGNQYSGFSAAEDSDEVVFWYQDSQIRDLDEGNQGGMIWEWTDASNGYIPISVYSTGAVVSAQTFATTSDRRIKTNISHISDDEALVQFRKLQPKKYNYIDFKKKTTQQVYGFIAQEVAEEIPNSTTQTCDFIPDLYCYGEVDVCNNTIKLLQKSIIIDSSNQNIVLRDVSLNIDLSVNDTLKCYDASNDEFEIEISNIEIVDNEHILTIDTSNNELSKHSYYNIGDASVNILHNNLVFIYGKKVDDLHHLKKDSIWTVAAAALQEVDRQQQADKVRISELETEVITLKNQVSTFETQISELLARVSSLENNSSTTTDGS